MANEVELERMIRKMTFTGVYCICCVDTGKRYVGSCSSSRGIKHRLRGHVQALTNKTHCNKHLQRAWDKYGSRRFKFTVLEKCASEMCVIKEQFWIDKYASANPQHGYNLAPTAGSMLGFKHPEESRLKISEANKKRSPESRKKHADQLRGRKLTAEHRAAISSGNKQAWKTGITREFSANARQRMGSSTRGKKPSPERIAKMLATREANGGFKHSEETKKKLKESAKRRGISSETMSKIIASKRSVEGRKKASELAKRRGISSETRVKMLAARWPHIYGGV